LIFVQFRGFSRKRSKRGEFFLSCRERLSGGRIEVPFARGVAANPWDPLAVSRNPMLELRFWGRVRVGRS